MSIQRKEAASAARAASARTFSRHAARSTSRPRCVSLTEIWAGSPRSEEHTSELQSLAYLVCRIIRSEKHTSELQSLAYLVCRLLRLKKHRGEPASPPPFACIKTPPTTTR